MHIRRIRTYSPASSACVLHQTERGPWAGMYLTLTPSGLSLPSALISAYSSRSHLVNPNFLLTKIFRRPENLNLERLRASIHSALNLSCDLTEIRICPILTRAAVPWALPKAPLIPV